MYDSEVAYVSHRDTKISHQLEISKLCQMFNKNWNEAVLG